MYVTLFTGICFKYGSRAGTESRFAVGAVGLRYESRRSDIAYISRQYASRAFSGAVGKTGA